MGYSLASFYLIIYTDCLCAPIEYLPFLIVEAGSDNLRMIGVFCLIDEFHTVLRLTLLGVCSILHADCLHSYYDA